VRTANVAFAGTRGTNKQLLAQLPHCVFTKNYQPEAVDMAHDLFVEIVNKLPSS